MYEITTPAFCSNVLWEPLLQQLSDIKEGYGKVHCNKPWCQPPRGPHIDARRRHMINTTRGAPQPPHYITQLVTQGSYLFPKCWAACVCLDFSPRTEPSITEPVLRKKGKWSTISTRDTNCQSLSYWLVTFGTCLPMAPRMRSDEARLPTLHHVTPHHLSCLLFNIVSRVYCV